MFVVMGKEADEEYIKLIGPNGLIRVGNHISSWRQMLWCMISFTKHSCKSRVDQYALEGRLTSSKARSKDVNRRIFDGIDFET